jgi:hypothetical protein
VGKIALFCGMTVFSTLFAQTTGQRLRKLKALPDDYDSAPPRAAGPNQPIELKLS